MAKTQSLSLNPTKISGACGRLMCCLKYEQEAYEDLLKNAPKNESFVDTPDGRGTVTEVSLLRQCVKVRMEDHPETVGCYHNCDICVLRSGKARKNDPPIPKDLAPISSKPRKVQKPAEDDDPMPELIYSSGEKEPLLEATPLRASAQPEQPDEAAKPRRRKRSGRGRGRSEGVRPAGDKPAAKPAPEKPAAEKPAGGKPSGDKPAGGNPNNRRRRSRGRRGGGANAAPKAE